MLRILLKFSLSLIILLGLLIGYLSIFGIETNSFNKLIQEEVSKSNENLANIYCNFIGIKKN